jgi:hypothetical protein
MSTTMTATADRAARAIDEAIDTGKAPALKRAVELATEADEIDFTDERLCSLIRLHLQIEARNLLKQALEAHASRRSM